MPTNILDLAKPEPIEADEHIHPVERMTGLDHAAMAFGIAMGIVFWAIIGMVISTLLHLSPLASLVVVTTWPIPLGLMIFISLEVLAPIWRLIRQKAERIEGYND